MGSILKATIGRLPAYLRCLRSFDSVEHETVSAQEIASALGLGVVQVRKDLAAVSGSGKPKVGYDRAELVREIEAFLDLESRTLAILIGAGALGRALLACDGFAAYGIEISAAFDSEIDSEGELFGRPLLPMERIRSYCVEHDIRLGIITVSASDAQDACDMLVSCGVAGIWSFAPVSLSVPQGIIVKREDLALSLAHLRSLTSDRA